MKWGSIAYVLTALAIVALVSIAWLVRTARKAEAEARDRAQRERQRLAAEAERLAEEKRLAEERAALEARACEEARLKAEVEARASEKARVNAEAAERERLRLATESEAKRLAEEKRAAEARARQETEARGLAEDKARREAEAKRLADEKRLTVEKARIETDAKAKTIPEETRDEQEVGRAYHPPVLRPPRQREARRAGGETTNDMPDQSRTLEVRLQVLFDRHGFVTLNLLAAKPANSGEEFDGKIGMSDVHFAAIGDGWFQVAQPDDLGRLLDDELRIRCTLPQAGVCRWSLSKRSVYVLAPERGLAGFVSTARLRIGYEQVVLCRHDVAEPVRAVLSEAGCLSMVCYGEDRGVPRGWALFKSVAPKTPVPQGAAGDILNILRPLPEIEIQLEAGLRMEDTTWLAGFPPEIRVLGAPPPDAVMQIDTKPADRLADGRLVASGYDAPGNHSVFIGGKSVTYWVQEYQADWQPWKAHDLGRGDICGAAANAPAGRAVRLTTVSTSNPVLVGAAPGEIFFCSRRPGNQWTGFVSFEPVWALPADPLHCDRRSVAAILLKPIPVTQTRTRTSGLPKRLRALVAWCTALGDCRRKGLQVSPADVETLALWRSYQQVARAIRRKLR